MKLSIIIVSYNTLDLIAQCLASIYTFLEKIKFKYEVIVVDNASSDGSVNYVKNQESRIKNQEQNLILIENRKNLGFAVANNQGIKRAKGEFILFINPDTQIIGDAIEKLIKLAEEDNKIGVVGPRLIYKDGSLQYSVGFFPHLFQVIFLMLFIDDIPLLQRLIKPFHVEYSSFYKKIKKVDWVSGACMLIRANVLKKSNLFDEKIFMYGEEVELCYRIKKCNFLCFYTPQATILHHKGASGEGKYSGIYQEYEFLKYFYKKYKPAWQLYLLYVFLYLGALFRWILFGIILKEKRKANPYAKYIKMAG